MTDSPPTKHVKPEALFKAGHTLIRPSATHCNFAGDECWNVRVHPVIESIDATTGFTTGGQELVVRGFGLSGADEIVVDGQTCTVISSTDTTATCRTGKADRTSTTGYQPGQPGLKSTTITPRNEKTYPGESARTNGDFPRTYGYLTSLCLTRLAYKIIRMITQCILQH